MKEFLITNCERSFVTKAIQEGTRLDGRKLDEFRKIKISFGSDWGCVHVSLGDTRVFAQVSCEVQQPKQTRPNEGLLNINLELSPMAAPHFDLGRQSETAVQLNRLLEKALKDSCCVDLESLCIIAEEKVWALRVDVNVLNHEGNLMDCASIAALTAIAHFKRPDVTTTGEQIIIHSLQDRDPLPIVLHHHPVCISFAIFNEGDKTVADPTALEEAIAEAQLVLGVNSYRELCGLHLGGSALASPSLVLKCANKAGIRAMEIVQIIKESLAADLEDRALEKHIGFAACIQQNKITSLLDDKIHIRLNKWELHKSYSKPSIKRKSSKGHIRFDDDGMEIPIEDENEVEPAVKSLGHNTAELIIKPPVYGEGGPNSWFVASGDDSENSTELEAVKQVDKITTQAKKMDIDDENSEEDETVVMKNETIAKKSKKTKKAKATNLK